MVAHKDLATAEVHKVYRQEFADEAARLADATVYTSADLLKKALQVDTNAEFLLTSFSGPITWTALGSASDTLQAAYDGSGAVTLDLSGSNDMKWDGATPDPLGAGLFATTMGAGGLEGAIHKAPNAVDDGIIDGGFSIALPGAGANQTTAGTGQAGTASGPSIYGGSQGTGGVGSAASGGGVPGAEGGSGGSASLGGGGGGVGGAGDTADAGGQGGSTDGFNLGGAIAGTGGAAGSASAGGQGGGAGGTTLTADDGGDGGVGTAGGQSGSGGNGGELVIAGGAGGTSGTDNGGGGFDGGLGGPKSIVAGRGGSGTGAGGDGGNGGLMEVFGGDAGGAAGGTPGTAGKLVMDAGLALSGTEAAVDIGAAAASGVNLGRSGRAVPMVGIPTLPTFVVAGLPSVSTFVRGMIWVSDETGGAQPAFSNGTNWLRFSDGAIVS